VLGVIANHIRAKPPLPYKPMPLGWLRRQLAPYGLLEFVTAGIASWAVHHRVTEFTGPGRVLWRLYALLDRRLPRVSAHLGCYVQMTLQKIA